MIELSAADRLKVHLTLYYPKLKMRQVRLSADPGYLEMAPSGRIDIRGAGYAKGNPPLRLWNELHGYFTQHIEVIKRKYGLPTLIAWNGMVYHLDQAKSFKQPAQEILPPVSRRQVRKSRDRIAKRTTS